MLGRRSARAERGMPRGWTALCLLSLLPSAFTNVTTVTTEPHTTRISLPSSANVSNQEMTTPSSTENNASSPSTQDNNGTIAAATPETTVNITPTPKITSVSETMNSSVQTQTSLTIAVPSVTANFTATEMTLNHTMSPGNVSDALYNSTSLGTSPTTYFISFSSTQSTIKGEIRCIKDGNLTRGICLELNKISSCEGFRRQNGEELTRILCGKDQAEAETRKCSLTLIQSDVRPHCLLLVLANSTEHTSKLQLLKTHESDLRKLGIQRFTDENVGSHQSYSRKTLIALVTSGILLAVLGITGYFLMNRRSWSPTGERLGEDPYYTENGGGQGYSSGPGASSEAQGKASVNRGAQENGTGQATSRNGHSTRQHVVADTEL